MGNEMRVISPRGLNKEFSSNSEVTKYDDRSVKKVAGYNGREKRYSLDQNQIKDLLLPWRNPSLITRVFTNVPVLITLEQLRVGETI